MYIVLAAVFLNSIAFTGFAAAMAWEALRLTGTAGAPALVFAASSAASLCCGPFLGAAVDKLGPKRAFVVSQVLAAAAVLVYGGLWQLSVGRSYVGLMPVAIASSVAGALYSPAMHGVIQGLARGTSATTAASRTGVAVASGFVLGYTLGGYLVDALGISVVAAVSGALYLAAAISLLRVSMPARAEAPRTLPTGSGVLHGVRYLLADRALRDAAAAYALCYTIFHLVTALLAPFSKLVLQADASRFGLLRASWSVGSALGALLLTALWGNRQLKSGTRFLAVAALGALFVVFSQSPSYLTALMLIGVVGSMHSVCRAFLDGLLLEVCDGSMIGRVRSNVNSLLSAVSLTVFGVSSLVTAGSIRSVFAGVGAAVSVCCVALYVRVLRPQVGVGEAETLD
jgi:MFS family permease